jgi:hypothetical protein
VVAVTQVRTARWLLVGLLVLGLGWLLAPRWAPPVYDGVGFPDQPYRFVVRPHGAPTTPNPTVASRALQIRGGVSDPASAASSEQAPQISILIPTGRIQAPAGTTRVVVQGKPVQPIAAPAGGHLWSNVYDVSATDPKIAMRDGNPPATITLRAATAQRPYPAIERYVNGAWTKVSTVPVGQDIYQAKLPGFGKYAVVGSSPLDVSLLSGVAAKKSAPSRVGIIIAVAAIVVVVGLFFVGERRRSRRRKAAAQDDLGEHTPERNDENEDDPEQGAVP